MKIETYWVIRLRTSRPNRAGRYPIYYYLKCHNAYSVRRAKSRGAAYRRS